MFLTPLLNLLLRPNVNYWLKQTRNLRPTIKIGKEKFEIKIDVHHFKKDELRVKARPEYVIIEGKQERNTKTGYVTRQFIRKFKLPEGCSPQDMHSKLSPNGILTITAARKVCDTSIPCENIIPISFCDPENVKEDSIIPLEEKDKNVCSKYMPAEIKDKTPPDKTKK